MKADLTGKKLNRWTVIEKSMAGKKGRSRWLCICDCGTKKTVDAYQILHNLSKSCGCLQKETTKNQHHRRIDLEGKVFGRLKVLKFYSGGRGEEASWLCQCECGKKCITRGYCLRKGHSKSCGCWRRDGNSKRFSGKNSNLWKGGKTPEHLRIRMSIEYRLWREAVFSRDNWTCMICGKRGGHLNADHIKSFSQFPDLRFAIDNGRTLCIKCHQKTPTYGGNSHRKQI